MARGLDEIVKRVIQFRDERDWRQFHDPKNLAEAICRVGAVRPPEAERNPPFTFWGLVGSISLHSPYDISGDMVTGRNVAVLFLDPSNFLDAVVIAVWT